MKIEDQVCFLELANKLNELGVDQDSLIYYLNIDGKGKYYLYYDAHLPEEYEYEGDPISAFTVSELGNMLPNYVTNNDPEPFNGFRIHIEKFISAEDKIQINNWIVNYHCDTVEVHGNQEFLVKRLTGNIYDSNLANAMAKMLIYLIENKLMELP